MSQIPTSKSGSNHFWKSVIGFHQPGILLFLILCKEVGNVTEKLPWEMTHIWTDLRKPSHAERRQYERLKPGVSFWKPRKLPHYLFLPPFSIYFIMA